MFWSLWCSMGALVFFECVRVWCWQGVKIQEHTQHRVVSGWITHSKFYTSSSITASHTHITQTCFGLCGVHWGLWSFLSVCARDVGRVSKSKNTHNTGLSLDELHIQNSTLVPALQPHTHTNIVNKCDIYIYTYHLFNHLFTHPK